MSRLLVHYRAAESHGEPATPRMRRSCARWGYLSRGPRNRTAGAAPPDPKDRLAELHLYEKAEDAVNAGRMSDAVDPPQPRARGGSRKIPSPGAIWEWCMSPGGNFAKARGCFENVLAAAPDDYLSHYELGIVYDRLGQRKEALDQTKIACELAPLSQPCRAELEKLARPPN